MKIALCAKLITIHLDISRELRYEFLILLKILKDLILPFQMHRLRASDYF